MTGPLDRLRAAVRLAGAVLLLSFIAAGWGTDLQANEGTCKEETAKGCITSNDAYPGKACAASGAGDCWTCNHEPSMICTFSGGGKDLADYCDPLECDPA